MKHKHNQQGFHHLAVLIVILVSVIAFAGYTVFKKNNSDSTNGYTKTSTSSNSTAVKAGKSLSNNQCSGTGTTTFTHLPMNSDDFALLIPYGLTIGGHVTPIDHQYFSPTVFNSPKDKYPVYAMADATITDIEVHPPENGSNGRIRLVFSTSCTFLYYYDLVTGLEPGISKGKLPIKVKAGQLIGHIGGQTLDFAVWNTEKKLTGFINPDSYKGEPWKIYTDNPTPYFTAELQKVIASKNPRKIEPTQGKIDYDIDGKLIGNWFLQGSGGYNDGRTPAGGQYWDGHLSIAPDLYDPTAVVFSVGNYEAYPGTNPDTSTGDGSKARQYFAKADSTDPAAVGVGAAVKYELVQRKYTAADGSTWVQDRYTDSPKANNTGAVLGTVIAQLTDKDHLKFEVFKGKTASQVSTFTSNAKIYTR